MNVNNVIKYPILSEKTYAQMQNGVYTFAVDTRTNKTEIKKAVEFIFDVKVDRVNVINYDKKEKRVGKFQGYTNAVKKAIVYLADGQINIFPEEVIAPEAPVAAEEVKSGPTEAEIKAAEKIAAKAAEKEAAEATEAKSE